MPETFTGSLHLIEFSCFKYCRRSILIYSSLFLHTAPQFRNRLLRPSLSFFPRKPASGFPRQPARRARYAYCQVSWPSNWQKGKAATRVRTLARTAWSLHEGAKWPNFAMFGYVCGDSGVIENDEKGIYRFGCSLVSEFYFGGRSLVMFEVRFWRLLRCIGCLDTFPAILQILYLKFFYFFGFFVCLYSWFLRFLFFQIEFKDQKRSNIFVCLS